MFNTHDGYDMHNVEMNYDVIIWGLSTCGSFMYNYVDGITEACDSSVQIYDMHEHAIPCYL